MSPEQITTLVQTGGLSHQQAIHIYAALYGRAPDAPVLVLPCEQCGALTPLSHVVSYKLWVAMPGHPAIAGFDEHDQHFCCSHDCARAQIVACFDGHLRPEAERRVAQAQTQAQGNES